MSAFRDLKRKSRRQLPYGSGDRATRRAEDHEARDYVDAMWSKWGPFGPPEDTEVAYAARDQEVVAKGWRRRTLKSLVAKGRVGPTPPPFVDNGTEPELVRFKDSTYRVYRSFEEIPDPEFKAWRAARDVDLRRYLAQTGIDPSREGHLVAGDRGLRSVEEMRAGLVSFEFTAAHGRRDPDPYAVAPETYEALVERLERGVDEVESGLAAAATPASAALPLRAYPAEPGDWADADAVLDPYAGDGGGAGRDVLPDPPLDPGVRATHSQTLAAELFDVPLERVVRIAAPGRAERAGMVEVLRAERAREGVMDPETIYLCNVPWNLMGPGRLGAGRDPLTGERWHRNVLGKHLVICTHPPALCECGNAADRRVFGVDEAWTRLVQSGFPPHPGPLPRWATVAGMSRERPMAAAAAPRDARDPGFAAAEMIGRIHVPEGERRARLVVLAFCVATVYCCYALGPFSLLLWFFRCCVFALTTAYHGFTIRTAMTIVAFHYAFRVVTGNLAGDFHAMAGPFLELLRDRVPTCSEVSTKWCRSGGEPNPGPDGEVVRAPAASGGVAWDVTVVYHLLSRRCVSARERTIAWMRSGGQPNPGPPKEELLLDGTFFADQDASAEPLVLPPVPRFSPAAVVERKCPDVADPRVGRGIRARKHDVEPEHCGAGALRSYRMVGGDPSVGSSRVKGRRREAAARRAKRAPKVEGLSVAEALGRVPEASIRPDKSLASGPSGGGGGGGDDEEDEEDGAEEPERVTMTDVVDHAYVVPRPAVVGGPLVVAYLFLRYAALVAYHYLVGTVVTVAVTREVDAEVVGAVRDYIGALGPSALPSDYTSVADRICRKTKCSPDEAMFALMCTVNARSRARLLYSPMVSRDMRAALVANYVGDCRNPVFARVAVHLFGPCLLPSGNGLGVRW
jgi:hypothetical protein